MGETHGGIDVGRAIEVGLVGREQRDDADELRASSANAERVGKRGKAHDGLDGVDGHPALSGVFVPVLVVSGRVLRTRLERSRARTGGQRTRMEMQTVPSA